MHMQASVTIHQAVAIVTKKAVVNPEIFMLIKSLFQQVIQLFPSNVRV